MSLKIVSGWSRSLLACLTEQPPVSAAYSFLQSGAGDYSIEPSNLFTCVDADGNPRDLYATVEAIAKIKLSGNLAVSRHTHGKRATFSGCSAVQQKEIKVATKAAQKAAAKAYSYVKKVNIKKPKPPKPRYTTWFGAYDATRLEKIRGIFKKVSKGTTYTKLPRVLLTRNFSTTANAVMKGCMPGSVRGSFNYEIVIRSLINRLIRPIRTDKVWICSPFWRAKSDLQKVALIHEATHFFANGGTQDLAYGRNSAELLAKVEPDKAAHNAYNYMYFVQNAEGLE